MPVMDGYAATAELRRREGAGRRVPVVAIKVGRTPAAAAFARVHSNADTCSDLDHPFGDQP